MIRATFAHAPGIGGATERKLWLRGIDDWEKAEPENLPLGPKRRAELARALDASRRAYVAGDAGFFAGRLPASEQWRLFPDFRGRIAFLDIETTGMGAFGGHITTIVLYDGGAVDHFVHGRDLERFPEAIAGYDLVVTYNGKRFDVPWIEAELGCRMPRAHLDLCPVLRSLGYRGGLKGCERALGLERPGLEDVDGAFAVMLWHAYRRTGAASALETLLAYNAEDVLNLERLAVAAFNEKLAATPFADQRRIEQPSTAVNPFRADEAWLERIRAQMQRDGIGGSD